MWTINTKSIFLFTSRLMSFTSIWIKINITNLFLVEINKIKINKLWIFLNNSTFSSVPIQSPAEWITSTNCASPGLSLPSGGAVCHKNPAGSKPVIRASCPLVCWPIKAKKTNCIMIWRKNSFIPAETEIDFVYTY